MGRPLRIIIGIFAFYVGFSLAIGTYELTNGGPWYTYENSYKDRIIMGQERTSLLVQDENGEALSIIQGYAFPGSDKTVIRKKDSQGKYVFIQKQELPVYIRIIDTIFYPMLFIFRALKT